MTLLPIYMYITLQKSIVAFRESYHAGRDEERGRLENVSTPKKAYIINKRLLVIHLHLVCCFIGCPHNSIFNTYLINVFIYYYLPG